MIDSRQTAAKAVAHNVPIDQERQSEVRRRSDTVVVLTINDASWGFAAVDRTDSARTLRETLSLRVPGEVWLQS